jgi:hypothetical protein
LPAEPATDEPGEQAEVGDLDVGGAGVDVDRGREFDIARERAVDPGHPGFRAGPGEPLGPVGEGPRQPVGPVPVTADRGVEKPGELRAGLVDAPDRRRVPRRASGFEASRVALLEVGGGDEHVLQ